MKKTIFAAAFAACLIIPALTAHAADAVKLRIGYATAANGPHAAGAAAFVKSLETSNPDAFEIEQFPGGSLGGEREMVESVQIGSLDMAIVGTAVIGNFVPKMMVADMPFLFRDYDHARKVMDGPVGTELLEAFRPANLVGLAFGEIGFRHITNSLHPVKAAADLDGLKIRTMENPVHIAAFRALGAQPTPMAWTEVLTGLQQGTIDGQENPISVVVSAKLWEMQDYITLSHHVFTPVAFVMSPTFFDALDEKTQEVVRKAAHAGAVAMRAYVDRAEKEGVADLKEHGMKVTPDLDTSAFEDAMKPVYEKYGSEFADLIERIKNQ